MITVDTFPDVEDGLCSAIAELLGAAIDPDNVDTRTPIDLQARLPFITVNRHGGHADLLNDHPAIDIACYASTRGDARILACAVMEWLIGDRPVRLRPRGRIDTTICTAAPFEVPYPDPVIRRFVASYQGSLRR